MSRRSEGGSVAERVRFAHEDLEFTRAVTFFDAIFAFAVTLLITTVDDFSPCGLEQPAGAQGDERPVAAGLHHQLRGRGVLLARAPSGSHLAVRDGRPTPRTQ